MNIENLKNLLTVLLACGLDYLIGDPINWPHPVQYMGLVINYYQKIIFSLFKNTETPFAKLALKFAGIILAIALIGGTGIISWLLLQQFSRLTADLPLISLLIESIILASCFAGKSLRQAAIAVLKPLRQNDLITARQTLSLYVGRDTANLDEAGILRAVLETVTENAVDGVTAPLFYAMVGAIILPIGAVPLALAYKAASTLDSMVGYKEAPFTDLGWCSAKLEDVLTWLPCRLTVLAIALLSGKPDQVLKICWRDARQDPSPNSGWSECVYAVSLGVQVGGANTYRGVTKNKPLLGEDRQPITPAIIEQALQLTRLCCYLWLLLFSMIYLSINFPWGRI